MEKINNLAMMAEMKRFQQILEYTTGGKGLMVDEAGNDEQPQDDAQAPADGGMPMGDMGGAPMPDGGAPADGGMPMGDMGGAPMPDGGAPADGGMPMGDMGGNGQAQGPQGFNPQVPQDDAQAPADGMPMDGAPADGGMPMDDMGSAPVDGGIQPDDDVVDITDLTDAQEDVEKDVDKLDDKFDKVMKYLGKFEELIKANDDKINDLRSEFEKRNPTQIEKLSMQTANSYPFNVTPESYWKEKEATSNYSTENDDNGKEQGQYVITKNDVDGAVDWKTISDSLSDFDIMHQSMNNTMPKL